MEITIYKWIQLIFGKKQKYRDYENNEGLLFEPTRFISFDEEYSEEFKNDNNPLAEFGIIPLRTIYHSNELTIKEKSKSNKNITKDEIKNIISNKINDYYYYIIDQNNKKNEKNINNGEYKFEDNKKNEIKILSDELGKIEIYSNNILIKKYYDQKNIITYIHYNKRLNMFITTSLDGFSCLYSFPNKLLNVIKKPNNGYFDYILLAANPFPHIIAYDKANTEFYSYSLNGILIDKRNISNIILKNNNIKIVPILDINGGTHKDLLIISLGKDYIKYELPFFEEIKEKK